MNVNGISNQTSTYAAYKSTEQKAAATETEGKQTEVSAVYEPSAETEKTDTVTAKQKNEAIISRLKADADQKKRKHHSCQQINPPPDSFIADRIKADKQKGGNADHCCDHQMTQRYERHQ